MSIITKSFVGAGCSKQMQVAQGQGLVRICALVQAAIDSPVLLVSAKWGGMYNIHTRNLLMCTHANEHLLQLALCGGGKITTYTRTGSHLYSCISFLHSSLTFLQATLSNITFTSASDNSLTTPHLHPATQITYTPANAVDVGAVGAD